MSQRYLSKTDIMAFLQCHKRLHLEKHRPEIAEPDQDSPDIINGIRAGLKAREMFPNGVLVNNGNHAADPFAETQRLMRDPTVNTIFEAAFRADGVEVFTDIINRDGDGWELVEVKAATSLENHHIKDAAIQAWTMNRAGVNVTHTNLMHIDSSFYYDGNNRYDGLFKLEDISSDVDALDSAIQKIVDKANITLDGEEPHVELSTHCNKPNGCPCKQHCQGQAPIDHVSYLPNGYKAAEKLLAEGINRISNIPSDFLKSPIHKWVREVTLSGKEMFIEGAEKILDKLPFPHHFFDFETIQHAVPVWKGVAPFRQVPFQWSNHTRFSNGEIEHKDYIDVTGKDPRRAIAESIVDTLGKDQGAVLVYYAPFEKSRLKELGKDFPDLKSKLDNIIERIFDLHPLIKKHYYAREMKGSWSIKKVLPQLVPHLSYDEIGSVKNGTEAQTAYFQLTDPHWTGDKTQKLQDSRDYCGLDTYSMVELVDAVYARCNFGAQWRERELEKLEQIPVEERELNPPCLDSRHTGIRN